MKIKLHQGQSKILRSNKRFIIACAGTQGGKSFSGPSWLAREVSKYSDPDAMFLVVFPTYDNGQKGCIRDLITQYRGTCYEGHFNASSHIYTLPTGQAIYFRSAERPEHLQGGAMKAVWFDEAGMCQEDAWRAVQQRLSIVRGRALITTTPYAEQWLADIIQLAKEGHPEYDYINWPSNLNPYFPPEEWEARKNELPGYLFRQRYMGEFGPPERAAYPEFNEENITNVPYNPELPILVGCDFNNSPLHWILAQAVNGMLFVYDEIYIPLNAKTTDALAELIDRHNNHKQRFIIFGDASSKAAHTSSVQSDYAIIYNNKKLQQMGVSYRIPNANPAQGDRLNAVNALINAGHGRRLFVDYKCRHLIKDLQNCRLKEGTRQLDKVYYDGHGADALGYIINTLNPIRADIKREMPTIRVSSDASQYLSI